MSLRFTVLKSLHPNAPQSVTGGVESDGSVKLNWDAVDGAKSYLIHYADANETDPHKAKFMGYSETNSWSLAAKDVPAHVAGDKIPFYIQSYNVVAPSGTTDVEKAAALHDGPFIGSAWSEEYLATFS